MDNDGEYYEEGRSVDKNQQNNSPRRFPKKKLSLEIAIIVVLIAIVIIIAVCVPVLSHGSNEGTPEAEHSAVGFEDNYDEMLTTSTKSDPTITITPTKRTSTIIPTETTFTTMSEIYTRKPPTATTTTTTPTTSSTKTTPTTTKTTLSTTTNLTTTTTTPTTTSTTTPTTTTTTTPTTTTTTTPTTTTTTTPTTTTTTTPTTTTTTLPLFTGWTPWGSWLTCSVTCGSGVHKRYRHCYKVDPLDADCRGEYIQSAVCTESSCPTLGKWSTWFQWGNCDVSCGGGVQTRTRSCQKRAAYDLDCVGEETQEQRCNAWDCPDCSKVCKVGRLNKECDACVCESTTVAGRVVTNVGSPINGALIAAESTPTKILARTNSSGFFSLNATCLAALVLVTKHGFQDAVVEISGTTLAIEMKKAVLPRMIEQPQSKDRLSGENVTFCCRATGSPNITYYEWFRDSMFLSRSLYINGGTNLQMSYVKPKDSGKYTCRANSPIGAVMSTPATLKVKDKEGDFCKDALQQKIQTLPSDCVQPETNTATYEVGECVSRSCRMADINETNMCREYPDSCCTPSVSEIKTLKCTDYEMPVIIVKECGCGSCISAPIKVLGTVVSAQAGKPLEYVDVFLNGEFVAFADGRGRFYLDLSKSSDKAVITIKDTLDKIYLDAIKIIDITDGLSGSISITIPMTKAAPPVEIDSKQETVLNAVSNKNGPKSQNDSVLPAAQIYIPADAFVKKDGSKFSGTVSSRLTFIDPTEVENEESVPGRFQFIDEEGLTTNLASKGVFNLEFQDENGKPVFVNDAIDVNFPEMNDKNFTLWALSEETGIWEPLGFDQTSITRRRKRRRTENMIGELSDMGPTTWYNIDKFTYTTNACYYKVRVYTNKDLKELVVNPPPLKMEYHQTDDNTLVSFTQRLTSPEEQCLSADCRNNFGYLRLFYDNCLCDDTRDFLAAEPVLPRLNKPVTLEYDNTLDDGQTFKVRFASSAHGPFYKDRAKCEASGVEDSHLRFYIKPSVTQGFKVNRISKEGVRQWLQMVRDGTMTRDEMTKRRSTVWYPLSGQIYSVCHLKIKVHLFQYSSSDLVNIKFHVKSFGGTADVVKDFLFGLQVFSVDSSSVNTTHCIEYKCSGNLEESNTVDYTRIEIKTPAPFTHRCHITRVQNDLTNYNFDGHGKLNSNVNGQSYFKMYAPTRYGENYGIYKADTDNADIKGANKRSKDQCLFTTDSQNNGVAVDLCCDKT